MKIKITDYRDWETGKIIKEVTIEDQEIMRIVRAIIAEVKSVKYE